MTFARRVLHYWVIALFEILNLCLRTYFRGSNKLDSTKHVEALVGNKGEVRRAGTTGAVGTCIPVNKWQINLEILIISVARFQQIKQIKLKSRKVFHKIPYGLLNIFIPVTVEGFSWPWSCRKPAAFCQPYQLNGVFFKISSFGINHSATVWVLLYTDMHFAL